MAGKDITENKAKRKKERNKERNEERSKEGTLGGQREIWKHLDSVRPTYFRNVTYKEKEVQTQSIQSVLLHNMVIRLLSIVTRISC